MAVVYHGMLEMTGEIRRRAGDGNNHVIEYQTLKHYGPDPLLSIIFTEGSKERK